MSISIDVKKRRAIQCPVCYNWLQSPVSVCENGHGTCQNCRSRMNECGLCRGSFAGNRNILLNEIIEAIIISCPFKIAGCKKRLHLKNINPHKKACSFRTIKCPLCKTKCSFINLSEHLNKEHTPQICQVGEKCVCAVNVELWKGYPSRLCSNCRIRMFPIFIQEIETSFLIRMLYTTNLHSFRICVQYLGRKQKKATNFVYDIEINQNKKTVFHSSNEKIMPYRRLWKDILKENDAIAELNLKQILHDDFAFDLTIAIKNKLWYY